MPKQPSGRLSGVERCWHDFTEDDPDWCIPGGESDGSHGDSANLFDEAVWHYCPKPQALEWVRSIRDQCLAAGVPFFFKQWGATTPKAGGRLLDGRTWDEMPR